MHKLGVLTIAAAVAISTYSVPTTSQAMECLELCYGFYPPQSLLVDGDQEDTCQRRINDSGGFCTIHGKLNLGKDLPRGINYRPQDYTDPRQYYWDMFNIPPSSWKRVRR